MTTVTITAPVGPGLEADELVFDNVIAIKFIYTFDEIKNGSIEITYVVEDDMKIQYFDLDGVATVTYTITGADTAIVIS